MHKALTILGAVALLFSVGGCHQSSGVRDASPIVGAWVVNIPEAPFPLHMFIFHADGTVQQSNPDAGDASTSDSSLMGVWVRDGEAFGGRIVEVTADRTTHHFASRVDIAFHLAVSGNEFHGVATATAQDADGHQTGVPIQATLNGRRVLP